MNPENGNTKHESQGDPLRSAGSRKPYSPPRLRSLGQVNVMTLTAATDIGSRKKPQG
jgi:hypothetical protein